MPPVSRTDTRSNRSSAWYWTLALVAGAVASTTFVAVGLAGYVGVGAASRWGAVATVALAVVVGNWVVRLGRVEYEANPHAVDARFGVPNLVTLVRGVLLAWVAGFLLVGWTGTESWIVWFPALLYATAATLDAVDGALARRLDQTTDLGAQLDMAFDAFGLLVAPLVAVVAGQLPWWYLSVSVARYVFVAGIWLRTHRGLSVAELPPRASRRVLAGVQMAFVAVALTPTLSAVHGRIGAALFGGALLAGFVRDWLYVSGRIVETSDQSPALGGDSETKADSQ